MIKKLSSSKCIVVEHKESIAEIYKKYEFIYE